MLKEGYLDNGWTSLNMGDVIRSKITLTDAYWPEIVDLETNAVVTSYNSLFSNDQQPLRISGECGSGKTTFCKRLAFDWAHGRQELEMFEYVFYLNLGKISDFLSQCSIEAVIKHLTPALKKVADLNLIKEIICQPKKKMLLILDGLDEYSMNNNEINDILQRQMLLPKLHVLVTRRPETPCNEFSSLFDGTDFLIKGFTKDSAWDFAGKRISDGKSCDDFLTQAISKGLEECLCNPFLCLLLTVLYQDSKPQTLPESITEMYREIVEIFQRYAKKKHLLKMNVEEALRQLEELAYEFKMTSQSETRQIPDPDVLRLGIASGDLIGKLTTRQRMKIMFLHGSLQDFLLASWVVSNDIDASNWWKCKNNMIIKFICGLCKGNESKVAFWNEIIQKYITDLLLEHRSKSEMCRIENRGITDTFNKCGTQYRGIIGTLNELNREMGPVTSKYCNPLVLYMTSHKQMQDIQESSFAEELVTLPKFVNISFPLSQTLPRITKTKTTKGSEVSLCIEFTKDISSELTQLMEWLPDRAPISYLQLQSNDDQKPETTEINLARKFCLTALRSLQLSEIPNWLAEKILDIASAAKELNRFEVKNLRGSVSRDVAMSTINLLSSEAVHNNLQNLTLSGLDIDPKTDVFILIRKCEKLKYISMEKVNLKNQVTKVTLIHGQLTFMALNDCRLCDSDFQCIAEKLMEGRLPNLQFLYLHNPIDVENLGKPSYWSNSASSSIENTLKEAVAKHKERSGALRDVLYPPVFLNDETSFKTDWLNLSEDIDLD